MTDGGPLSRELIDDDGLDDKKASESLRAKKNWRQLKSSATAFGVLGGGREASLSDMLKGPEKATTTLKDVVGTVQLLRGGHDAIRKATNKETESLLLAQSEMVKDMGLVAILQRFRGAYKNSSFGPTDMFRTWWWYVKQDRLLCALTMVFLFASCAITFWAPEWVSVTMRIIFGDQVGMIPLLDFCGWLFLYVAIVAIVWAATWSLLFIQQRHFSQRMKWHVAVVGTEKDPQCKAVSSMLNLDELTRTDLPFANTFFFHVVPLCFCASVSVIMGFCMIFSMSWLVGMCAVLLFLALAIVSAIYDDVAMTKYNTNDAKVAKEAELWGIIHDEECSEDARNEAAGLIMEMANEKTDQTLGIKHVLMGVFYRLLTLSVPVFFFLVAAKTVVSRYLDTWEVVACAMYFFYMTMWATVITSALTSSHQQLGAALRLTLFVNGTNQSLNSKVPFSLPKLNRIRVQQQWGLMSLLCAGILATIGVAAFLFSGRSTTSCPAIEYTCHLSTSEVDWTAQMSGVMQQQFRVDSGCAFVDNIDTVLTNCADRLVSGAPRGVGILSAKVQLDFWDWAGTGRAFSNNLQFDTGVEFVGAGGGGGGRRLLSGPVTVPPISPPTRGPNPSRGGDDPCDPNPCQNGGRCVFIVIGVTECNCTGTGWLGPECETRIQPPAPGPVDNATQNASDTLNNMTNTTGAPTMAPTPSPTPAPTPLPTPEPTTPSPTTKRPTESPTPSPTPAPTPLPTPAPTQSPTQSPTTAPTHAPTNAPTNAPTDAPTLSPTTPQPTTSEPTTSEPTTSAPTDEPTVAPTTPVPTQYPTFDPTVSPTSSAPTRSPTPFPSAVPTFLPTSASPTPTPTKSPVMPAATKSPTPPPTKYPTPSPTAKPTTAQPTKAPTKGPTSKAPTPSPSTRAPTPSPTKAPTKGPTSKAPTPAPPTKAPTPSPTKRPTPSPTARPTPAPTTRRPTPTPPTRAPTTRKPTAPPSRAPTRYCREQEFQLQLTLTILRLRILILLRIDSLSPSQNWLRNRRLCNTGKLLWFSQVIFSQRDKEEDDRYNDRVDQCNQNDRLFCILNRNPAACIQARQQQREAACLVQNEGEIPSAADCTDRGLTFDRIKPTTCFECAKAICVSPGPADLLGGNPDAVVTVGTVLLGNPMAVKDQSMWYGRVGAAFDNFVVYLCGSYWEPLEIDMGKQVWIGGFALNGWNGGFDLKPQSWKFEASNDDRSKSTRSWTVLANMDDDQWYTGENNKGYPFPTDQIKSVVPAKAYQFFRINAQCMQSVTPILVENIAIFALPNGVPAPPSSGPSPTPDGGIFVR